MSIMVQEGSFRGWPRGVETMRGGQCEYWLEAVKRKFVFKRQIGLNQRKKHFLKFEGFVLSLEKTLKALLM